MFKDEEELSELIERYTGILNDAGIEMVYDETKVGYVHFLLNGLWNGNSISRMLTIGMIHQRLGDAGLIDIQEERDFLYKIINRDDKPYLKDTPPVPSVGEENETEKLRQIVSDLENKLEIAYTRVGSLTLKCDDLQDTHTKRKQWLDKAKQDAGFSTWTSFDRVWEQVLDVYKKNVSQEN